MNPRTRSRLQLLLLVVLFAAPIGAAIVLHGIGWEPTQTRNHGDLIQPPIALGDLTLQGAEEGAYDWDMSARRWHIAVFPPDDCAQICVDLIADLDKVWQLQGRRADRLDVLWFGPVPATAQGFRRFVPMRADAELDARLEFPTADEAGRPAVYLIDPRGFLALYFAPGFDAAGLREDVARLLK